jgi:hypothetical protein
MLSSRFVEWNATAAILTPARSPDVTVDTKPSGEDILSP